MSTDKSTTRKPKITREMILASCGSGEGPMAIICCLYLYGKKMLYLFSPWKKSLLKMLVRLTECRITNLVGTELDG